MKKIYKKPLFDIIEIADKGGVMQQVGPDASAGQINPGGGDVLGKENNFTFDTDPFELWGDESGDDDWLVDNDN